MSWRFTLDEIVKLSYVYPISTKHLLWLPRFFRFFFFHFFTFFGSLPNQLKWIGDSHVSSVFSCFSFFFSLPNQLKWNEINCNFPMIEMKWRNWLINWWNEINYKDWNRMEIQISNHFNFFPINPNQFYFFFFLFLLLSLCPSLCVGLKFISIAW